MWGTICLLAFGCLAVSASVPTSNPTSYGQQNYYLFPGRSENVGHRNYPNRQYQNQNVDSPIAFCAKHGYQLEEFKVTTSDGYILTLHRLSHGKHNATTNEKKEVVYLQHGLMSSSMDFFVTGPENALGFILAEAGFDVWLGNARGSTYSRQHKYYSTESKEFWQFSWNEIGEKDLPALINRVLEYTGNKQVHFIGHSEGVTAFFVMNSIYPVMQQKIRTFNAFAPIVYLTNTRNILIRQIAPVSDNYMHLYNELQTGEIKYTDEVANQIGGPLCKTENYNSKMCDNVVYLMGGWDSNQVDSTKVSDILTYSPASSSGFELVHYAQQVKYDRFAQFDFGVVDNMKHYHSPTPPVYDTSRVTIPVALYYSDNDLLADVQDVEKLANELPNVVGKYHIFDIRFNHMDFCWGKDAKSVVYNKVVNMLRRYPSADFSRVHY